MNEDSTLVAPLGDADAPRRKPWQMPQIEDVSVAVSTASSTKNAANAESSQSKNGS